VEDRDELILNHIGVYRLSFRKVLERMFFDGRNCGNVVQRLLDAGRIQSRGGLPNRVSYYQLTPSETIARGLPVVRSRPLKSQASLHHMGVLWFCCMSAARRVRMEPEELEKFDAGFPLMPQAAHCIEGGSSPRIYRVEVVGPNTGVTGLINRLNARIHEALKHHILNQWVRTRRYAFAILAESGQRRKLIEAALARRSVHKLAHIVVEYAPGHRTISEALNEQTTAPIPTGAKRAI
jgi:hypothetical protein